MTVFELILALLLGAALLSILARRVGAPYPVLIAGLGAATSLIPGLPALEIPADLILALLVAPVLVDAAHDMSLRDLRRNRYPVIGLAVVAIGLTTAVVALLAHSLLPGLPWAAAIALGALLAPPDAVAAIALMRQVRPPHRIRMVLEGESLFNDATSLLIYRLAVGSVAAGGFAPLDALPMLLLTAFGSTAVGWALGKLLVRLIQQVQDPANATILQFVSTYGIWLLAEQLQLSPVITVVAYGLTAGRAPTHAMRTTVRVISFATWETVTFVLNALAFLLVGLQLRRILPSLEHGERLDWLIVALACLVAVILVRFAWVFFYRGLVSENPRRPDALSPRDSLKSALVIGWSGMRGIVTLAAALALPGDFPYRDFILVTAFVVVLGTLLLQGLTLRPLLRWLKLPPDTLIAEELQLARQSALHAALENLGERQEPAARRLRMEYREALSRLLDETDAATSDDADLRRQGVLRARHALDDLRQAGRIGDDAYRRVEKELDWLEMSTQR